MPVQRCRPQTRHPSAQLRVGRRARNVHAAALTSWRLPNHGHVRGLHALTALLRLVLDLLALVEVAEAAAGDVREVHEDLAAAVVGGDEAIPLRLRKPF